MNPNSLFFAWLTMAVLMTQPARASRPSLQALAASKGRHAQMEKARLQAAPWRDSLSSAFAVISDSAERTEAIRMLFLTTYKHHLPTSIAKPAAKPADSTATASALATAWATMAVEARAAKLDPLEAAEAVYRFTNSDWAPVSATTGPGLDKVKSAKDYLVWGRAVIATGKKALAAKAVPADVWSRQAASYQVLEPADLPKVGLNPPRVRF